LVFASGTFNVIGGQPRSRLGSLDTVTGSASAWQPNPNAEASGMAIGGSQLYVWGGFTRFGDYDWRSYVAAFDATTLSLTQWDPNPDGGVSSLIVRDSVVIVGGWFARIGGQARYRLAAVDTLTAKATAWTTSIGGGSVWTMTAGSTTLYVGGVFNLTGFLAAIDLTNGAVQTGTPMPDNLVRTLVLDGNTLYVGGYFNAIGGQLRHRLARVDVVTGVVDEWDPLAQSPYGAIYSLAKVGTTLFAGGAFSDVNGTPRSGVVGFTIDHTTPTLVTLFQCESTSDGVLVRWRLAEPNLIRSMILQRSQGGMAPWVTIADRQGYVDDVATVLDESAQGSRTYSYRLVATLLNNEILTFGPVQIVARRRGNRLSLAPVVPNPASGPFRINFELPNRTPFRISVVDLQGREIATIAEGIREAGAYDATWTDHRPSQGLFFVRCWTPQRTLMQRVVIVR